MSVDVACEISRAPVVSNALFTMLVVVKNKLLNYYHRHIVVVVLKDRLDPWIGSQVLKSGGRRPNPEASPGNNAYQMKLSLSETFHLITMTASV
jgi:hypothetical protein